MPFKIIRNDITKMRTDAIVNAANTALAPGGGVCGAIFKAAGYDKLRAECARIGGCKTGDAVITKGYDLDARYIIHTAGPIYADGKQGEAELLYSCYASSLKLAKKHRLESIAFPLISSGIYGYPKNEALKIATNAVVDFLAENEMDIYLVVYDKKAFEVSTGLFADVKAYIDETMVKDDIRSRLSQRQYPFSQSMSMFNKNAESDELDECRQPREFYPVQALQMPLPAEKSHKKTDKIKPKTIEELLADMDKSFSETLLDLIDKSGMKDSEVYKKANVDRRLFSKIRSNIHYKPSKVTAVAFAIALKLDLRQTRDLLGKAGYSMTHSNKFDIIIEYFITRKIYDIYEINEVLFAFDQSLIGV